MSSNQLLLSLKSWPEDDPELKSVSSLITRIQAQRGHFRDVDESILENEIREGKDTDALFNDSPVEESEGGASNSALAAGEEPDRATQLKNAKAEIVALVGHALNEALFGLDYVSLLVSLQNPEAGSSSMSPELKKSVPVGSLGFNKVQRRADPGSVKEDLAISHAWKVEGLNSAADTLMGASKKLGDDVGKEARYWEQILAIREDGWVVTRMPNERRTLGVRFGFAESAAEYKNKGVGALRRGEDGDVVMDDVATTGSHGKAMLRVRVLENGEVKGSSVQSGNKCSGSVKDMIQRARNFIYEDELFFEITREARLMANYGVRTSEDAVTIDLGGGRSIVIDMAPLDDGDIVPDIHNPDSNLAQGVVMAFRILLSYNHRMSLRKRSKPPPPLTQRKIVPPALRMVAPITTHLLHHQHQLNLQNLLRHLIEVVKSAGMSAAFVTKPRHNCLKPVIKNVETAVEAFLERIESEATVKLPGGWKVEINMKTALGPPLYGTAYIIGTSHDGVSARLMGENRFTSSKEMEMYLFWCLERSIVNEVRYTNGKWEQIAQSNEMWSIDKSTRRIRISVDRTGLSIVTGTTGGKDDRVVWDGSDTGRTLQDLLNHPVG
ncbi:subunit 17 of mediator complex-domain-containing protein [Tuber indicum]|nr:subunit 17 of mediator complex-domain-containing protein [Tuber indicum]